MSYVRDRSLFMAEEKYRRELFLLVNILLIQPLQCQNVFYPTQKNFTKGYDSVVTHILCHLCDMSLITACAIFCSLKFHVVYTIMYFNLTPDKSENDQDMVTLIDLHIVQFDI